VTLSLWRGVWNDRPAPELALDRRFLPELANT
jgi:hypothetical protein